MVQYKIPTKEVSFEWKHERISFTDLKISLKNYLALHYLGVKG